MKVTQEQETQIRTILRTLQCPQDCPCHVAGFETLGRVQPIGDTGILECLEPRGTWCACGMPFGAAIFCMCPLRKYLADEGVE